VSGVPAGVDTAVDPLHDALAGLRVVDLTRLLPGPLATLRLAQWGAEVLKVEDPGEGDGARALWRSPAEAAADEPGPFYRQLNAGKRVLRLDLRSAEGRAALLEQLQGADVLVEGFRPGVMARLGLGYETVSALNPKLVMVSISGYGQQGAWAQRAGHDINYIAMAGVLEQVASHGGELALPNFQIGDLLGGSQAALSGLLAAVLAAQRTGRGRHVDISMTHEVMRHQVVVRTALEVMGRVPPPARDLLSGGAPCYGVYRTADGRHLAVGALELKFWQALCAALGRPQWERRHWSLGETPGSEAALALRAELQALLATQALAHWVQVFDGVDACVTPVLRLDEALRHPLFAAGC
jgi:crotonobetainyl-CoA:carnitine CoA-transferase CaiB-like acyl-CoA transferase